MKKQSNLYLKHILDAIDSIHEFMLNKNFEDLEDNDLLLSAVIRKFEIIGEAVARLSKDFKDNYPQIEWNEIKAMRNFLIHQYDGVSSQEIWDTIQIDLPELKKKIKEILNKE